VSTLTTHTTNMTGLRSCTRGSSLASAEPIAGRMIAGLKIEEVD
jgi:hypothetical protein